MSTYHVDGRVGVITSPGIWRVLDDTGRVVGYGTEAEDAARIARALSVLDAMERETVIDGGVLCLRCHGDGTIKIPGGVSVCPTCRGRCRAERAGRGNG